MSGTVIYLSLGICTIPESVQSDENLFIRVLKVSVYGVKKMRILLGSSILFLMLGFNKVTLGVIFRRFGRCKGNFLGDNISARIDVLVKVNFPAGVDFLIGCVLGEIGFNILEIISFSKVASIYFVTGDKVNLFLIAGITE